MKQRQPRLVNESNLDNVSLKVYQTLLERFGEPIHDQPSTVGARDEGPGDKALWNDEPKKDRNWSDPKVVHEGDDTVCQQCGMMHVEGSCDDSCNDMDEADKTGYIPPASGVATHFNDDDLDEVTPPGGEKVVKALKKQKSVKNPWAVAWSMKNKGDHFKK